MGSRCPVVSPARDIPDSTRICHALSVGHRLSGDGAPDRLPLHLYRSCRRILQRDWLDRVCLSEDELATQRSGCRTHTWDHPWRLALLAGLPREFRSNGWVLLAALHRRFLHACSGSAHPHFVGIRGYTQPIARHHDAWELHWVLWFLHSQSCRS